jgi:heme exporter protein B
VNTRLGEARKTDAVSNAPPERPRRLSFVWRRASALFALKQAFSIARKDLAVEFRTKESINAAGAFSVAILVLFSFAFDPFSEAIHELAGGLLWVTFAFAGALVFNRGFARELPNECLDTLLASPLLPASLLLGKSMAIFIVLLLVEIVCLCVFGIFYNMRWWLYPGELALICGLASWGIAIIGSVFGALTVNLRLRELMLPVIIYPLLIPLLIGAIEMTNALLGNQPFSSYEWLWAKVVLVFDIVFTSLAVALAETILVN